MSRLLAYVDLHLVYLGLGTAPGLSILIALTGHNLDELHWDILAGLFWLGVLQWLVLYWTFEKHRGWGERWRYWIANEAVIVVWLVCVVIGAWLIGGLKAALHSRTT
jgi:hypothetical protein